jgi:hypothetical protein
MSDLLNSASLVVIPSGYKEDTVYSVVPSDGSGDLAFTRASNGTRINSAGLVEVCPWNFMQQSNAFSTSPWAKSNTTLTSGQSDPNGGTSAWKVEFAGGGNAYLGQFAIGQIGVVTISAYFRADSTTTIGFNDGSAYANSITIGTTWQRYEFSYTVSGVQCNMQIDNYFGVSPSGQAKTFYIYGAQLNIGSTAKPYFPTTDRLNVPRLTYQNGGGGCPSLLLEKQSTNIVKYSEQLDNTGQWNTFTSGTGSVTITANYATSPDGTQNADRLQLIGGSGYAFLGADVTVTNGATYTYSVWLKALSGTPNVAVIYDGSTVQNATLTSEWVRYTFNFVGTGGVTYPRVGVWQANWGTSLNADVLAWGAQLEASSYPTSYIPTTSSSATRVADVCTKTGIGALIGGTSGTVFFDIKTNPTLSSANYKQFCYYFTSGGAQSYMFLDGANKIQTNSNWGSLFYNTAFQPNTRYKVALVYAPNDFALYVNGVSVATASSGTPNNNVDLQIGQFNGSENCEFVFNQYTHFPSRLTNAELASLTTI